MSGAEEWQDVGGNQLIKWDVAKVLEGVLKSVGRVKSQYGEEREGETGKHQTKAVVMRDDGTVAEFYATAILERILTDPRVVPGARIRVEYTGTTEKTSGGRNAKSFKVQVKGA